MIYSRWNSPLHSTPFHTIILRIYDNLTVSNRITKQWLVNCSIFDHFCSSYVHLVTGPDLPMNSPLFLAQGGIKLTYILPFFQSYTLLVRASLQSTCISGHLVQVLKFLLNITIYKKMLLSSRLAIRMRFCGRMISWYSNPDINERCKLWSQHQRGTHGHFNPWTIQDIDYSFILIMRTRHPFISDRSK